MKILHVGHAEPLKAGVHAAVGGLAALCATYNALAWLARRKRHLAFNAVAYTVVTIWEVHHVRSHTSQRLDEGDR